MSLNLQELRDSARRKVSFDLTSSDYSDEDLDASLNEWMREVTSWSLESTGAWETSGEISTTNFIEDQSEYVLPEGSFISLNRVEVKYPNSDKYVKATRIDDKQVDNDAIANGSIAGASESNPVYRVFDNSIFIYPAPTSDVSAGISMEHIADLSDLESSTDIPNVNPLVSKVLATGAAYDFASANEMDRLASRLYRRIFGSGEGDTSSMKYQVQLLSAQRDRSVKVSIKPRYESLR